MLTKHEINIRDPFVLAVEDQNLYYLYGTRGSGYGAEYDWLGSL